MALVLLVVSVAAQEPTWESASRNVERQSTSEGVAFIASPMDPTDNVTNGVITWTFDVTDHQLQAHWIDAEAFAANLSLEALVAFRDLDGDGELSIGDPLEQRIGFDEMLPPTHRSIALEGGHSSEIVYRSMDDRERLVTLTMTAVGAPLDEGPALLPTELALDVTVHAFPRAPAEDGQTLVALLARWDDRMTVGDSLHLDGPVRLQHDWTETAAVDGTALDVRSVVQYYRTTEETTTLVAWVYPPSDEVEHAMRIRFSEDPTFTEEVVDRIVGDWPWFVTGLAVTAALIGWPAYRRLREGDE